MPRISNFPIDAKMQLTQATSATPARGYLTFAALKGNWTIEKVGSPQTVNEGQAFTGILEFTDGATNDTTVRCDQTGDAVWEFHVLS